ncbi:MAG TPA: PAS domain-containing protein [Gemmatimonadaceae bacterium]|nr:PAS domain-containing protein [Gemmatimonadaceae bacterium]
MNRDRRDGYRAGPVPRHNCIEPFAGRGAEQRRAESKRVGTDMNSRQDIEHHGSLEPVADRLFAGPGYMRSFYRRFDWAASPLGPVDRWPASLRTAAHVCLDSAFASFVWWGSDLVQLYNDAALAIVRAKHPRAFAVPARDGWSDVWMDIASIAARVLTTGESVRSDDLELLPDRGGDRAPAWFTCSWGPLRDDAGDVAGLYITAIETTERMLAERRLGRMVGRAGLSASFRALFEAAPTPCLVLASDDFTIVAVNSSYLRATKTERREILGRPLPDVYPVSSTDPAVTGAASLRASLARVIATRRADTMTPQKYEVRRPRPGAGIEVRWWSPVNVPVLDAFGAIALIIHRVEDVTDLVRLRGAGEAQERFARDQQSVIDRLRDDNVAAARALERERQSDERHRLIVEGARDHAIFTTDERGRIDSWSPGAEAVFGWTAGDAIGQPMGVTFTPEDRAAGEPAREQHTARDRGVAPDVRWHVRKNGQRVFIEGTTRALHDDAGRLRGFLKVGQDVTERHQAEIALERSRGVAEREELRRRLAQAEEEERRRLSRELHDEAGQHLTALGLGLQALSDVAPPGSEVDRRAAELRALADTLGRELHAIAVRLRPKALDDFGLEAALVSYTDEWTRQFGIPLDLHATTDADRLPAPIESTIYRVVQEALTNVARHSGASRASVLVERRDRQVVVVIEDDGRGFDPTAVAGAPDRAPGLGLLGVRERVALLRGMLDIESAPDAGATVFVRIPIDPASGPGRTENGASNEA